LDAQKLMGKYDFLRAKALFAIDIDASVPHIHPKTIVQWYQAKHPLLYLNYKKNHKEVVPLDIKLVPEKRILIISGPNAGGKSVCLKSVGLLQYMMQCGLPVSMMSTSDMGIFEHIFIDIGDEQSIDNDLSTYSSHLQNLKVMDEQLNEKSLFLIDEFGSGTEPTLGGALAESILESYYDKKAFGIITTHYGNLKMFSDTHPEAENGAMLFDTNALIPLYILKIGKPGSSFTYEIARHIGLNPQVIDNAIQKSGTAQIDYERKLEEIEITQIEAEQKLKMVRAADDQLAQMIDEYAEKFAQLDKQRKEILTKAKNQANSIVDSANKIIENTIREIKESKADSERTKKVRSEVQVFKKEMQKEIESIEKAEAEAVKPIIPIHKRKPVERKPTVEEVMDKTIRVGDSVYLPDSQIAGEVTQIDGNDVMISFHSVNFRTKLDKLIKISKKEARNVERGHVSQFNAGSIADALNKKLSAFNSTLDVRGQRAEEMMHNLEEYLDEAAMLGVQNLRILHGKGNGILRSVVRQYLARRQDVAEFHDEMLELGGAGITVVKMKK
ncbi:MAG: Smr/MutS family protein, partial [Bacteroidales bacterium]|nr:Smr/MutS family protein [Bacteroidales bacterium]